MALAFPRVLRNVKEIRAWLPEADLSNLRLHPAAHRAIEIEQPGGRTDKRGQFVLPVNAPAPNADVLFEQAQAAENAGNIAEAERLDRVLMDCDPTDAAPPFNLGNMFRATGRKIEAEAAPRALIRPSRKLGTIFPTYWTSKVAQKPQSIVCAVRCRPTRNTLTRCLISRCCFSKTTSTRRPRSTGGVISPMTLNLNGQHAHVDP